MPALPAQNEFFLEEKTFQRPAFAGQELNLFSPEAEPLKLSLHYILVGLYSDENLEFLQEVYDLNQKHDLTDEQLTAEVQKIEGKYIKSNSEKEINVIQDTREEILISPKHLTYYKSAVIQVFDLISHNVTNNIKELAELEKIIVTITVTSKAATYLAGELDKIIQVQMLPQKSGILSRLIQPVNDAIFADCQTSCAKAKEELISFTNKFKDKLIAFENKIKEEIKVSTNLPTGKSVDIKKKVFTEFQDFGVVKKEFTDILDRVIEKLSRNYQQLIHYEKTHSLTPIRSAAIDELLETISSIDKRVNKESEISKKSSSSSSKLIRLQTQTDSISQTPTTSLKQQDSPNVTPRSASRRILPPLKEPGTPYKISSRATISSLPDKPKEEASSEKKNDEFPTLNTPGPKRR